MKVTASLAISSMVVGVAPLEAPTPRLSKVMTVFHVVIKEA